jgi:O-antigen/teichoic acid export membrane protein
LGLVGLVRKDDFFKKGSFMFLATGITGAVNILFRAVMGRMLTVEEFGEFNAIFAVAFYLSFIMTRTIRTSTTNFISQRIGRGEGPISTKGYVKVIKTMGLMGTIFIILFLVVAYPIMDFLKIDSIWIILSAIPFLAISWVLPVNLGLFQGSQRFLLLAISTLTQASIKLVGGAALVLMGLGAFGAMLGVGIGALGAFTVSLVLIFVIYKRSVVTTNDTVANRSGTGDGSTPPRRSNGPSLNELVSVSGHVMIAILCLAILTNIDVLLVKHFFSSEETGLYSAAVVFGRIIYFLPVGFITVMYPKMVQSHSRGTDSLRILAKGIIYISLPVLAFTLFLSVFPTFSLKLLMGTKYLGTEDMVVLYSTLMFIFSVVSVLVYYFLAVRSYTAIYIFAGVSILQIVVAWFHHPNLETIIWIFIWANLIYLAISSILVAMGLGSRDKGGIGDG